MEIMVNGKKKFCNESMTVSNLLDLLGIRSELVVVEKNLHIVDRTDLGIETVRDGDAIEIIRLVAGG